MAALTSWSYSRYADYTQCPLMFKLKHIDRLRGGPTSPAMERGSAIHKDGERYLGQKAVKTVPKDYKFFNDEMKELKKLNPLVEQQWGFAAGWKPTEQHRAGDPHGWFAPDTWLRIVTDVCVKYDDNTVDIIDFKTGRMYATNQDQMDLFACGPFMKWPEVEHVTTRLWYLDVPPGNTNENVVEQEFTRKDFGRITKEWDKRIVPMFKDRKYAPKPGPKCKRCPWSKEKGGPCKF